MKKYEINRMAVLIDVMAECLGSGTPEIVACLNGSLISEEEAENVRRVLDDMEE